MSLFGPNDFIKLVQASAPRKAESDRRIRYYHDQQLDDLYKIIARRWSRPEDFRLFEINIVKKVISKLAMIYRVPPTRTAIGWDQKQCEALYKQIGADVLLKKSNRMVKLLKTCALHVTWDGNAPAVSLVTPNILDAVADNPASPDKLIVTHRAEKPEWVEFSEWTPSSYRRLDYRGREMQLRANPGNENPYNAIPFVMLFDRSPDDTAFLGGGDDLIAAQDALNVALVNLWRAVELQSHGQAVAVGLAPGEMIKSGVDQAIILPEGGSYSFAAPNTPVSGCLKAIEFLLKQTAITNGLSADVFDLSQRSESAAGKLMESRDLIEAREDDIENWRIYEDRLFNVLKIVVNTHQPGTIPNDASIRVDFAPAVETLSENARLESYSRRIQLGLWSPVDAILEDNADIKTREDAISILTERAAETKRFLPSLDISIFGTPGQ